jgi:hypothetical protein
VQINSCPQARLRQSGAGARKAPGKERIFALTSEDLSAALGEQGVTVTKPPYFQ